MCSKLGDRIQNKAIFWRLILGRYATMTELKEVWTLDEVMDMRDILDAKDTMEKLSREQARAK